MSEEQSFHRVYSISEVSERLETPSGTLRQWEKDFDLKIPRTPNNVRYYTLFEIDLFQKIKTMRDKNLSVEMIRQLMNSHGPDSGVAESAVIPAIPSLSVSEVVQNLQGISDRVQAIQTHLEELPGQMRAVVSEEVQKEFQKGNKLLQDELVAAVRDQVIDAIRKEFAAASEKKKKSWWKFGR